MGRQELRCGDRENRTQEDCAGRAMDRDLRGSSDGTGDPRWLRDIRGRRLLRRRQPTRTRQCDASCCPGGSKTGDGPLCNPGMAARLGKPGYLRRRNGSREDALWRLWHRRRICLHDGSRRSRYKIVRIRDPHRGTRTQVGLVEGRRPLPSEQQSFATKENSMAVDTILHNAKIATNGVPAFVEAVAVTAGTISATGTDEEILRLRGPMTTVIDGNRRTVIPGLNDSHMHPIRGGLNFNLELRWDGVPSLADALRMLKEQAARTPAPQWVRVVGGWTEFQFAERRMPTLDEINSASPDTPVFVM